VIIAKADAEDEAWAGDLLGPVGTRAEGEFLRLAKGRGLVAEYCASRRMAHDAVVNGLRVQVKHRTCRSTRLVQLCKTRRPSAPQLAYYRDEFDILALQCDGVWYLIEASALVAADGDTLINNLHPPDYADYIDNWGVFSGGGQSPRRRQMVFEFAEP